MNMLEKYKYRGEIKIRYKKLKLIYNNKILIEMRVKNI